MLNRDIMRDSARSHKTDKNNETYYVYLVIMQLGVEI